MNGFGGFKENTDMNDLHKDSRSEISSEAQGKFDKLMGDDKIQENLSIENQKDDSVISQIKDKFENLFKPSAATEVSDIKTEQQDSAITEVDVPTEPNSKFEIDGDFYETDDSRKVYKKNGELLPNTEYIVNGSRYRTDENGNQISCENDNLEYTDEGSRNLKEQRESGGEERQEDDDGGHIIAKILGGSEGAENLVPMRRTINRGDYKKMENEISKALQEGKEVSIHIDLEYSQDSQRPSRIKAVYYIDGVKTETYFDNEENSTELSEVLDGKISDEDYSSLMDELNDMQEDGCPASITSVKTEYDKNGNPSKVTVGVLDETSGIKTYKVYQPKGDE